MTHKNLNNPKMSLTGVNIPKRGHWKQLYNTTTIWATLVVVIYMTVYTN